MGLTPNHLLPYPELADEPNVPSDIYELANRLDTVLTARELALNARIEELERLVAEAVALARELAAVPANLEDE